MTEPTKMLWITDPHLNFLKDVDAVLYAHSVAQQLNVGDSVVITGDIAEGPSIDRFMEVWRDIIQPRQANLYFVLGNHDFYNSRISHVRTKMQQKLADCWLPAVGIADIGYHQKGKTCLVGHDGWYDGLYADWMKSRVWLNDYECIQEFIAKKSKAEKLGLCRELAREAATHIETKIHEAVGLGFKKIYVATHVPPFRENSVYKGKISDDNWLPHFSSKIMGDTLLELGSLYPDCDFVVLCGHSHGEATYSPLGNMTCHTGFAEYRQKNVANVFELDIL